MSVLRAAIWTAVGLGLQACAPSSIPADKSAAAETGKSPKPAKPSAADPKDTAHARVFQLIPEEAYWVTHTDENDRVVVGGARLVLSKHGEVIASAWERDDTGRNDPLQGSLAVLPHLGGGYVHWSSQKLFRSQEFTGPLEPIAAGSSPTVETSIRGARNGLSGVLIFTDTGPLELLPGQNKLTPAAYPGLSDFAAVNAKRAAQLDIFGRISFTNDGGHHWNDSFSALSIAPRGLSVGPEDLWIITWNGRIAIQEDGILSDPELNYRSGFDYGRPFQIAYDNTRASLRDNWPWGFRESPPLHAALYGGALLPDGTALGVSHGSVARVDLGTGEPISMSSDWLPQGLECIAHGSTRDGILFVCTWESYQGYGAYVLRSERGEPPVLEKAFSEDGYFVADDTGAIGYAGSCKAEPRFIDPDERRMDSADITPSPVFCVRKSPGEWLERRIGLEDNLQLIGWVPHLDGTASALVLGNEFEALPEAVKPHGEPRVQFQGGVRKIRVYQELGTFRWARPSFRPYMYGRSSPPVYIDKRFRADPKDGSIYAWMSRGDTYEGPSMITAGARIAPDGQTELYAIPPDPSAIVSGGEFGLAISRGGTLYETRDHGRTWQSTGDSPIPPQSLNGVCSRLGCVLSSSARLGWGPSSIPTLISSRETPASNNLSLSGLPLLSCEPVGTPEALPKPEGPKPAPGDRRGSVSIPTGYGDTLEIVKETTTEEPDPSGMPGGAFPFGPPDAPPPPPAGSTAPSAGAAKGSKKALAAPLRTHSLLFRPPFEADAPVVRLNATNASFGYRRTPASPVLGEKGEVALLLFAESTELLVTRNDVENLPSFETRRYFYGEGGPAPGLWLGPKRIMVLGDMRRRLSLEEHGSDPSKPPMYIGLDREQIRRRILSLGRQSSGNLGILVIDGPSGERAGVAPLDRSETRIESLKALAPWASLALASDPRCKAPKEAYQALISFDPSRFLSIDQTALPGVFPGAQGIALVRWGQDIVCLDALDISVADNRRKSDIGESHLVARWTGNTKAGLRWQEVRQTLKCTLASHPKDAAR